MAAEVAEHAAHAHARAILSERVAAGDQLAIAPQVLAEFIHIVTDGRRFSTPLPISDAIRLAEQWWSAREMRQVFPSDGTMRQFLDWLRRHALGRKRLLDMLLAATYSEAGISSLLTTNPGDFAVFGGFTCVVPGSAP